MATAKPSRTQRANSKPPSPKTQRAQEQAEHKRQLAKIREAAFMKGQRMAARSMAKRDGFAAGMKSIQGKSGAKTKNKGLW